MSNLLDTFGNLVFTARGTTGIWVLLEALKEQYPNRKLLLPINICEIVYPMILHAGWDPVFFDVDPTTGIGGLDEINKAFSGTGAVLLLVHNFGIPVPMHPIINWAKAHQVFVIEDVCNALGAKWQGDYLGSFGDAAIFSFGHAKILEFGGGGAVWVRHEIIKDQVKKINKKLPKPSEKHQETATLFEAEVQKFRKSAVFGADYLKLYLDYMPYLLVQPYADLNQFWSNAQEILVQKIKERTFVANRYREELPHHKLQHVPYHEGQVYWRYNIHVASEKRDAIRTELQNLGVFTSSWYPPLSDIFHCAETNEFPNASRFHQTIINLFVDHHTTDAMQGKLIQYFHSIPS